MGGGSFWRSRITTGWVDSRWDADYGMGEWQSSGVMSMAQTFMPRRSATDTTWGGVLNLVYEGKRILDVGAHEINDMTALAIQAFLELPGLTQSEIVQVVARYGGGVSSEPGGRLARIFGGRHGRTKHESSCRRSPLVPSAPEGPGTDERTKGHDGAWQHMTPSS